MEDVLAETTVHTVDAIMAKRNVPPTFSLPFSILYVAVKLNVTSTTLWHLHLLSLIVLCFSYQLFCVNKRYGNF